LKKVEEIGEKNKAEDAKQSRQPVVSETVDPRGELYVGVLLQKDFSKELI
jgi:hypothetical protein